MYSQSGKRENSADTTDFRNNYQQEILLESQLTGEDESEMLDFLENLRRNPLNLNKAAYENLALIPFLNKITAQKIIEYRNENKFFHSKRELLKIEGITEDVYERIKIYLIVPGSDRDVIIDETGNRFTARNAYKYFSVSSRIRTRFIQDLQIRDGYLNGNFQGSRPKIYNQINSRIYSGNYALEINFTAEKDAGEKRMTDFVSGYVQLNQNKFIREAVAGDYTVSFGQGLALWSSSSFSKGIDAVTPLKKRAKGIDGHSSADEVRFFRGAAAKLFTGSFNLSLLYSDNHYDATVDTSSDGLSGFYYDGYHRTSSEINRQNAAREKLFGGRMGFEKGSMNFGITYWQSKFTKTILPDSLRNTLDFSGDKANMTGVDYDFIFKNMNFYGEFARSQSKSIASFNALQITLYKFADVLISYRNYPSGFASVHSYGFGEKNGNTANERGFYTGITLKPFSGLLINGYYDQFKFPYRTYFDPVSTSGTDFLASAEWKAVRGLHLNLKYKNENKEITRTVTDEFGRDVKIIDDRNQLNARAGLIYHISGKLRFRSRFEYVYVDYKTSGGDNKGIMFFSDIRVLPVKGLSFDIRYIIFDTDDYDSRIYEYENDIKGVMSNTALYGKGNRWYLLLKYKPFPYIEISGKYYETYMDGVKSIGSGNDKINGNTNNRISLGAELIF